MEAIGRYQVIRHLATGGMAEVYLARTIGPGPAKSVVVKRLLPSLVSDTHFVGMFLDEARLAVQLHHPNIVQIFDLGQEEGQYFIAMEYVDGPSLHHVIGAAHAAQLRLPLADGLRIVSLVLEALAYTHARTDEHGTALGLIHRDVSPENILLSRAGEVKLADFGIARAANRIQSATLQGGFKGKLHYLAPEMLRSEPFDARSDLFSVGVVLYQVLAGRRPFDGASAMAVLQSVLKDQPTPLRQLRPKLPSGVQRLIDRALAKHPDARYPDARAMQADLGDLLREAGGASASDVGALIATLCPDETGADDTIGNSPTYVRQPASPRRLSVEEIPIQPDPALPRPPRRHTRHNAKTQPMRSVDEPADEAEPGALGSATEEAMPQLQLPDEDDGEFALEPESPDALPTQRPRPLPHKGR